MDNHGGHPHIKIDLKAILPFEKVPHGYRVERLPGKKNERAVDICACG